MYITEEILFLSTTVVAKISNWKNSTTGADATTWLIHAA